AKIAAVVRGKLARAVLGDKLLDAQHESKKALPKADILDRDLTLMTTNDPWTGLAAQVGAGLGDHLAELSKDGLVPTAAPDARAEHASRSAVPFAAAAGWEPAAANHRLRWRSYLTELAGRTADDHWYDERQSPYFKAVANRYVADANRLTGELRALTPPGAAGSWGGDAPDATLDAKLKAPPLTAHDLAAITWTSELDRTIPFNLGPLPKGYRITGHAVAVGRFGDLAPIRAVGEALSRPLLPIPGDSLGLSAELKLDVGAEEKTRRDCRAACMVYFRGQQPTQQVTIHLNCKPELVIAEPPPTGEDRGRMVAVRADRNVELGSVVILLDYSGSMDGVFQKDVTRKQAALKAVSDLLKALPKETPLRIRVFSDKDNKNGSRVVFGTGKGDDRSLVTWDSDQDQRYRDLVATLDRIVPWGNTPLAQSIIDAANNDFAGLGTGSKTLLVLTDGSEDDGQKRGAQAQANFIAGRAKALANGLAGQNVALHVVQFAVSPGEQKEAGDLFRPLGNLQPELVKLWHANNANNLLQALLDAMRPKLKLLDRNGGRPDNFPQTGLPSRADDRGEPPYSSFKPYWSKWISDNTEGPFKVWAYPNRLPNPTDLILRPGERMLLGFGNQGRSILVRRELFADYIRNPRAKTRRDDKLWALSVPDSKVDNQENFRFHSLAFLEKVPPHLRGKVGDGSLEFAPPELTWWQVTPTAEKGETLPPTGTVRVTRSYGYPAPGWDVSVEGWP
ncbi:MAG TPA: hypothetical protein VFG68_09355, partial [Fimbriiglobus sp.]|nr:hypothetical protein [Fimbriiglobus sp.]